MNADLNVFCLFEQVAIETLRLSSGLAGVWSNSRYRPPYSCNIFEKYNSTEPITSWSLARIFSYAKDGDFILLKSFVSTFISKLDIKDIKSPTIVAEREGHVDVLIKEKNYCIIIENKLKNAVYQQNQIARYIKNNENYPIGEIYIVLLPKVCGSVNHYASSIRKSVWKLPPDYWNSNGCRECSNGLYECLCDDPNQILEECQLDKCKSCIDYSSDYLDRTVTIHSELAEWLLNECLTLVPADEIVLSSFIIQFADFLKLQYNTRESEQLKKEMKEYLKEQLKLDVSNSAQTNIEIIKDKINDVQRLLKDLKYLRTDEYGRLIEEWYNKFKNYSEFSDLIKSDGKSFGILIQDIWCGCWYLDNFIDSEDSQHPYWGFRKNSTDPIDDNDRKIVSSILADCNMTNDGKEESDFVRWKTTDDGFEDCLKFYYSARKLGYLK